MNKICLKSVVFSLVFIGMMRLWGQEQIGLKYNPATPTVAEMIKPNDIPVNESTGKIFPSIPLYTLTAGDIQVPISVTYNGNGIKVGQSPGILGYNWQLSYGGKVTRNLRDKPDEEYNFVNKSFQYYQSLKDIDPSLDPQDNTAYYQAINELVPPSSVDTEKDIFQFELLGYSGSFMIFPVQGEDYMYEGRIIKGNQEVKIRYYVNFSDPEHNRTFYITLPNGITGIFGGEDYLTQITKYSPPADMSHPSTPQTLPPSIFYIREIFDVKNNFVRFNYGESFDKNDVLIVEKGKMVSSSNIFDTASRPTPDPTDDDGNGEGGSGGSGGGGGSGSGGGGHTSCYSSTQDYVRFSGSIKGIQSIVTNTNNSVNFNFDQGFLSDISVFHYGNNILNITFSRISEQLPFLEKIQFIHGNENYYYQFEYYYPDQFPCDATQDFKAIDYWGYYNGEDANTSLIKVYNPAILCDFQQDPSSYRCNRSADLESSQYGALKRIYYPTGGYKEFEYELPEPIGSTYQETETAEENMYVYRDVNMDETVMNMIMDSLATDYISTLSTQYQSIEYFDFDTYNFESGYNALLNLSLEGESDTHVLSQLVVILADITGDQLNGYQSYSVSVDFIGANNNGNTHSHDANTRSFYINVNKEKKYRLLAYIPNSNEFQSANLQLDGQVSFTYRVLDDNNHYLPGLRIKRIKTYENPSGTPLVKRFYYNKLENYSTNYFLEAPYLDKSTYLGVVSASISDASGTGGNDLGCQQSYTRTRFLSSESMDKILIDDNNRRLYPYVTISLGGDHFEQGAIEKQFIADMGNSLSTMVGNSVYAHYGSNDAWMNGTPIKEIYFKNVENNLDTIKTVQHFYKIDPSRSVRTYNYIVETQMTGTFCEEPSLDRLVNIAGYTTDAWWISEDSTVTTEYFPTGKVVTWTKNYYDSHYAGMPDRVRTADSKGNILESRTYYPGTALTGLEFHSAEDSDLANRLYQLHRLTSVLQQEQYLNGNLLSASRIGYHHWTDNNNGIRITEIIQPDSIWQKKQGVNDWDLQTIAYRYDYEGHLLEASKAHGTHVYFLYGYNNTKIIAVLNFVPCLVKDQTDCDTQGYHAIQQAIDDAIYKSSQDNELGTEDSERELRQALSTLHRVVSDLHSENYRVISAYTYDPPIGMTGKMDEKGDWSTYHYDLLGRLQYIKDKDGNIRKEYQYNYIQSDY